MFSLYFQNALFYKLDLTVAICREKISVEVFYPRMIEKYAQNV